MYRSLNHLSLYMVSVVYDCETKANLIEVTNTVQVCSWLLYLYCLLCEGPASKNKLSRPKLDN